jgi:hypothetical protein
MEIVEVMTHLFKMCFANSQNNTLLKIWKIIIKKEFRQTNKDYCSQLMNWGSLLFSKQASPLLYLTLTKDWHQIPNFEMFFCHS